MCIAYLKGFLLNCRTYLVFLTLLSWWIVHHFLEQWSWWRWGTWRLVMCWGCWRVLRRRSIRRCGHCWRRPSPPYVRHGLSMACWSISIYLIGKTDKPYYFCRCNFVPKFCCKSFIEWRDYQCMLCMYSWKSVNHIIHIFLSPNQTFFCINTHTKVVVTKYKSDCTLNLNVIEIHCNDHITDIIYYDC